MISALRQYLRDEVWVRRRKLALSDDLLLAAVLAPVSLLVGSRQFPNLVTVGDFVGLILSYSAIALGFCLAGLTMVLTLPDREFVAHLSSLRLANRPRHAYSELFFVFSWSAVIHWAAILAMLIAVPLLGFDTPLFDANTTLGACILVTILIFLTIYGLFRFLVTLITISQVGSAYSAHIVESDDSKGEDHGS